MTATATRRVEWDMGHRLKDHGGKCKNPHGHRYAAEVTVSAPIGDDGLVLDFGQIKSTVGAWIDEHLDHTTAYERGDSLMGDFADSARESGCKPFYEMDVPPTAENLACLLGRVSTELLKGFAVTRVRVYETPNCYAEWAP